MTSGSVWVICAARSYWYMWVFCLNTSQPAGSEKQLSILVYVCVKRDKCDIWVGGACEMANPKKANKQQTEELSVHFPCFLCLYFKPLDSGSFLSVSPNSHTYPVYFFHVISLALPRLVRFHLTYFFSILTICLTYTNRFAPLSSLYFFDSSLTLSLMNTVGFFFFLISIC